MSLAMTDAQTHQDAHVHARRHARRRERLINRLPVRIAEAIRWLMRPESRWARFPAGVLFVIGGFLSILPVFGLWMLPVGLFLLAEDLPWVRHRVEAMLDWVEKRRPHWFSGPEAD
jgi:hypothetical protein